MDLSDLKVWHYGLIIGGAILVLGLVLYFLGVRKVKVASVVPAGFAGLAVGFAAGVIWLAGFGYKPLGDTDEPAAGADGKGDAAPQGGGMGKGGAGKGGGFAKGGPGGAAPTPQAQLVTLINALDVIVDRPVTVSLTTEDRAAIAAQLRGLDAAGEIKEDDARAKLEAILKVVEKDRKALEAIGYRWPSPAGKGGGAPKGGPPAPEGTNPLQTPETAAKVKSLQDRLGK